MEKEKSMPTTENKTPSETSSLQEDNFEKEIKIAEEIRNKALENYKQIHLDTWNIQHTVIRNYLWLSVTLLAAYFAVLWKTYEELLPTREYCPFFVLTLAIILALASLILGILSMTGSSTRHPSDNYVEMFDYLTTNGYDQGNHYSLLKKEIKSIKEAIERENGFINKRGLSMRWMNKLLIVSISLAILAGILYLISLVVGG